RSVGSGRPPPSRKWRAARAEARAAGMIRWVHSWMSPRAFRIGSLVLLGAGSLLPLGCAGRQPPPQPDEARVVDQLFKARFLARPTVRDLGYARVWQACRGPVALRVTCSAFYDHQLGDEVLAAHIGWPPGVP